MSDYRKSWAVNDYLPHLCIAKRASWESFFPYSAENIGPKVICWFTWWKWMAASVLQSSLIHSFIQQVLTQHLLCAGHCPTHLGHNSEQNRQRPCPHEAVWECVKFCSVIQGSSGGLRGRRTDCCVCAVSRVRGKVSYEKRCLHSREES